MKIYHLMSGPWITEDGFVFHTVAEDEEGMCEVSIKLPDALSAYKIQRYFRYHIEPLDDLSLIHI